MAVSRAEMFLGLGIVNASRRPCEEGSLEGPLPLGSRRRVILKDFPDTDISGGLREWLSQIRANMPGGVDPQAIYSTLLNKGPNSIVVRFDAGVVFSVEANLVVPIQHCCSLIASIDCTI